MTSTEKSPEVTEPGETTSSLHELAIRHRASDYPAAADELMPVVTACNASPTAGGVSSRKRRAAGLLRKRRASRVRRRRRQRN